MIFKQKLGKFLYFVELEPFYAGCICISISRNTNRPKFIFFCERQRFAANQRFAVLFTPLTQVQKVKLQSTWTVWDTVV